MKNILVTGGLGFIGSHTIIALCEAGYKPIILDNLSNSKSSVLRQLETLTKKHLLFYKHDFSDSEFLNKILSDNSIEGVIHLAAFKSVGESIQKPLTYYRNNVAGLITLLSCLKEHDITNIVFSSSATVYGKPRTLPLTEESPLQPATSPYGASKLMCETILRDTAASSNMKVIALRYFNPIGAHPSGKIGELPLGVPANLVPFITQAAAGVRKTLTVFGDDYDTPDGSCIRDYVHVMDLAEAHVKALGYLESVKHHSFIPLNIGTGEGTSVIELIKTFELVTGVPVPYKIGKRRAGDVPSCYADVTKSHNILDWQSKRTLQQSLKDAWRWQQNSLSL